MERIFELKNVIKISFCRNKETKKRAPCISALSDRR
jgi:hypothetical protein